MSHALLVADPEGGFERRLPGGSVEIYNFADGTGRTHLSEIRDQNGIAVKLSYDKWGRLESVTDAIKQMCKIRYASETKGDIGFLKI